MIEKWLDFGGTRRLRFWSDVSETKGRGDVRGLAVVLDPLFLPFLVK